MFLTLAMSTRGPRGGTMGPSSVPCAINCPAEHACMQRAVDGSQIRFNPSLFARRGAYAAAWHVEPKA